MQRVFRFLLALCAGSDVLLAQPFFFRQDIPAGPGILTVTTGDFNGDHRPDIAVNAWMQGIYIILNQGGGAFSKAIPVRETQSPYFRRGLPLAADFNGDGKDDLATDDGVFLSRGDGTFQPVQKLNPGGQYLTQVLAASDFNKEGKSHLLINDAAGTRFLLSDGDGTFHSGPTVTGSRVMAANVADLNRDGRADLICLGDIPPTGYAVFLGNGDGTFGSAITVDARPSTTPTGISFPDFFQVVDFNGDGIPDLAVGAGMLLGKGDGTFGSLMPYPIPGSGPSSYGGVIAADLTGDGKTDFVLSRASEMSLFIAAGNGDGTFATPSGESVGLDNFDSVAAADVDGDGRRDLVIAIPYGNTVSVLMNKARRDPTFRRAVSTASGTAVVTPQSLATLFAQTGVATTATASPPWPTSLGGITLEVQDSSGTTRIAPLVYASGSQINFQVPSGTAVGEALLSVVDDRGKTPMGSMRVDTVAPGLFLAPGSRVIPAATAMLVQPNAPVIPISVGAPIPLSTALGAVYVTFYATGFRGANPDNVTCEINGTAMPVLYAGPQQTPGVDQINIRLLPEVTPDVWDDGYNVVMRINGVVANPVFLRIQ